MPFPRDVACGPQGEWIRRGITTDSWIPVLPEHETTIVVASSAHLARIDTAVADIRAMGFNVKAVEKALWVGYRAPVADKEIASAAVKLLREKLVVFNFPGNRLLTRAQRAQVSFQSCGTPVTHIFFSSVALLRCDVLRSPTRVNDRSARTNASRDMPRAPPSND